MKALYAAAENKEFLNGILRIHFWNSAWLGKDYYTTAYTVAGSNWGDMVVNYIFNETISKATIEMWKLYAKVTSPSCTLDEMIYYASHRRACSAVILRAVHRERDRKDKIYCTFDETHIVQQIIQKYYQYMLRKYLQKKVNMNAKLESLARAHAEHHRVSATVNHCEWIGYQEEEQDCHNFALHHFRMRVPEFKCK